MINNKKHLLFSYDESEAWEQNLDYYYDDFKYALEDFLYRTDEKIGDNCYFVDYGKGMGWRNLEGYKVFKAETAEAFINAITPKTQDFTLQFYRGGKRFFYVKIYHHDAPMGERHKIRRLTEKEYNKLTE